MTRPRSPARRRALALALLALPARILRAAPAPPPDALQGFVVVGQQGRSLSWFSGRPLQRIGHVELDHAVHGAPQFSPDGRTAFVASADAWVSRIDLRRGRVDATRRTGTALRQIAVSSDGQWLMAAHAEPQALVLLNAQLEPVRSYAGASADGLRRSGFAAVVDAALRRSFIVALDPLPELWEISYDPRAEDLFDGIVHDYRMGEGIPKPGFLGQRRTRLADPLASLWLDPPQAQVAGRGPARADGPAPAQLVALDVRRRVAELQLPASTVLHGGASWPGLLAELATSVIALPDPALDQLHLVDLRDGRPLRSLPGAGGERITHHPGAAVAWVGRSAPHAGPAWTLLDRRSLQVMRRFGVPGPASAQMAFDGSGQTVLVAADAQTLVLHEAESGRELQRLAVAQPVQVQHVAAQRQSR